MSTLYKAMTRPAMYVGVPVVPLTVVAGRYFWGLYQQADLAGYSCRGFVLRMITKQDDHILTFTFLS